MIQAKTHRGEAWSLTIGIIDVFTYQERINKAAGMREDNKILCSLLCQHCYHLMHYLSSGL
jgi:hypothetical protein